MREQTIDIRLRQAVYADGDLVQPEYVMIADTTTNDAWLTIERRDRERFDGEQPILFDLNESR